MEGEQLMLLGLAIVVAPFALQVFLALGPAVWFLLGAVVFFTGLLLTILGKPGQEEAVSGVDCPDPDCPARNDADDEECHYCGTALETPENAEA